MMHHDILLLEVIENPDAVSRLNEHEREVQQLYLQEMAEGPGDGERDISWQEQPRGYYRHLEILEYLRMCSQAEYRDYLERLQSDLVTWRERAAADASMLDHVATQIDI